MQEVSHGGGRTVLVVSHNLATVRSLCDEGILMQHGSVQRHGPIAEVLDTYMATGAAFTGEWLRDFAVPSSTGSFITALRLKDGRGKITGTVPSGAEIPFEMDICATGAVPAVQFNLRIANAEGINLFTTTTTDVPQTLIGVPQGHHTLTVTVPGNLLLPGEYTVSCNAFVPNVVGFDHLDNILVFRVENSGTHLSGPNDGRSGVIGPVLSWGMRSGGIM
jgi:lipopolysaccharide transport system ATP-binding protein